MHSNWFTFFKTNFGSAMLRTMWNVECGVTYRREKIMIDCLKVGMDQREWKKRNVVV
jgi:hypothetical protein